jgi:hypothetical protein
MDSCWVDDLTAVVERTPLNYPIHWRKKLNLNFVSIHAISLPISIIPGVAITPMFESHVWFESEDVSGIRLG